MLRWIAILVLVCSSSAFAQDAFQGPEPAAPGETAREIAKKPRSPEVIISTLRRANAELESEIATLRSKSARRKAELRLNAFQWQAAASEVLLWIVVFMCLSGVVFSGFQLWRAGMLPGADTATAKTEKTPPKANAGLETGLEISATQLKVTSSVVGLIVLVISLAYLYLFLKDVYSIQTLERTGPSITTAPIEK